MDRGNERRREREELHAAWRAARGTFGEDMRLHPSRWARILWMVAGMLSAIIGVLGVLLPVLPGTPFLVLSAVCWVRSSRRLYVALLQNRFAGPALYRWRKTRTLEPRFRLVILATLAVSVAVSAIFVLSVWWARALVISLGLVGFIVILRIPTVPRAEDGKKRASRRGR